MCTLGFHQPSAPPCSRRLFQNTQTPTPPRYQDLWMLEAQIMVRWGQSGTAAMPYFGGQASRDGTVAHSIGLRTPAGSCFPLASKAFEGAGSPTEWATGLPLPGKASQP